MRRVRSAVKGDTVITTVTNLAIIGVTLIASVLISRALGPDGRGEFATLMAVFTIAMVIGELGQSASVTYFVASPDTDVPRVVASGRLIMVASSTVTAILVLVGVVLVQQASPINAAAYALALLGCLVNAVGGPLLYAIQAVRLSTWNRVRLIQPLAYVTLVTIAFLTDHLTILMLSLALVISTAATLMACGAVARPLGLGQGRSDRATVRDMARYGALASSAGVPISLGQNLDKVLLMGATSPGFVGHYAIASSVAGMTQPFAAAIGSVAFPRVAAETDPRVRRALGATALRRAALLGLPLTAFVTAGGMLLVPMVFGSEFATAASMLLFLAPGQFVRSLNNVMTSLLRGVGRPGAAAQLQIIAGIGFLAALLPGTLAFGQLGLGSALLLGEGVAFAIGWRAWQGASTGDRVSAVGQHAGDLR